ncbi:MAG: deoxyribose-phosphate aldolase [Sphingobacteriia bacterium]|nr:deoxyribose-phosphate aldolase [Sphingobacteriia bacterium]
MKSFTTYNYSWDELIQRAANTKSLHNLAEDKKQLLQKILKLVDLTTLEGSDTQEKIKSMCDFARNLPGQLPDGGTVAAVCFYMPFIKLSKDLLKGTGIEVATVAGGFPSGQLPLSLKVKEVEWCAAQGADEIDVVISRELALSGQFEKLREEISAMKTACGSARMKVILETGELEKTDIIRKASIAALEGGADFLKTSTGKIKPAATPEAFLILLDTIKEYYEQTGKIAGIKAAGGISETQDAMLYYLLVKTVLGDNWLNKQYFRIGASRLVGKIVDELK